MSHELSMRDDGTAEMAYVGQVPWHRLGHALEKGASMEAWRTAAGYNHEILRASAQFLDGAGTMRSVTGKDVLYRSDNNLDLSIVSKQYKVVQPADVLAYFADLADKFGFEMETAGMLFGGRQYWALANIGDASFIRDKKDVVKGRLLMSTSVDLTLPTQLKFVCERVVCHNTLSAAVVEKGGTQVRVRHRSTFNPDEVNKELGITIRDGFAETIKSFQALAEKPMTDEDVITATLELLHPDAYILDSEDLAKLAGTKPAQRIVQLAIEHDAIGAELAGCGGTAWGWLNAVTQFVDHESGSRSDDWRLSRAWFGDGDRMKSRAFSMAQEIEAGNAAFLHHGVSISDLTESDLLNT